MTLEILRRIANGILIGGAASVITLVLWVIIIATTTLFQDIVKRRARFVWPTRMFLYVSAVIGIILLIALLWLLGGLRIVPA